MFQLGRVIVQVAAVGVITSMLISCGVENVSSPTRATLRAPVSDPEIQRELQTEITTLKATLAANDFRGELDPVKDTAAIEGRRTILQGFLADLERQIQSPSQGGVLFDDTPQPPPPCLLNGNLNGCFLTASHAIAIDGSGSVTQLTSISGSQSAVVSYTDNGSLGTPISVSTILNSHGMSQPFSFPSPNCVAAAHTITSVATHQVSASVTGFGSISGHTNSSGGTSCASRLTVSVSPGTIGRNAMANIVVSGMTQCSVVSVSSSNADVATIQDYGNNNFAAFDAGPGTKTITATCGSQAGTASLSVVYPPDVCEDDAATNYGDEGDCIYPPPPPAVCEDQTANNYGAVGDCTYPPPPPTCSDTQASNYGDVGDCVYNPPQNPDPTDPPPPPPDGGGGSVGGGGDPDDPCYWDEYSDECSGGGGEIFAESIGRSPMGSLSAAAAASSAAQHRHYYLVLLDKWTDKNVVSMVGRFWHNGQYADAIYVSAKNPSALGWALAVRAMQYDRTTSSDKSGLTRVVRIRQDGTQSLTRGGKDLRTLPTANPVSAASLKAIESEVSDLASEIGKKAKHASKKSDNVQFIQMQ